MAFAPWIVMAIMLSSAALPARAYGEAVVTPGEPGYAVDVPASPTSVGGARGSWRGETMGPRQLNVSFRLTRIILQAADAGVDLNAAMGQMLAFYTQRSLAVGPPKHLSFPEGEALWVEAPNTLWPYSAAVVRRGAVFTARARIQPDREAPAAGLRETFFQLLRTVRPVRPEDLRLSNEFSVAAKTFLDLVAVRAARRTIDDPKPSWDDAKKKALSARSTVGDTLVMRRLDELADDIADREFEVLMESIRSRDRSLAVSPEKAQQRAACRVEIERLLKTGIATPTKACD